MSVSLLMTAYLIATDDTFYDAYDDNDDLIVAMKNCESLLPTYNKKDINIKGNKKIESPVLEMSEEFSMSDDWFRYWFQSRLNPNIDKYTLRKTDTRKIKHIRYDGFVYQLSCAEIFGPRGAVIRMTYEQFPLAWDFEKFRNWFQQKENPDVNPRQLLIVDSTLLQHVRKDGYRYHKKCYQLFPSGSFYCKEEKEWHVWIDPYFRRWFQKKQNPDVDPTHLLATDTIPLRHIRDDGYEYVITCAELYNKGKREYMYCKYEYEWCVWTDEKFRNWIQKELNPGICFEELLTTDNRKLKHTREDGYKYEISCMEMYEGGSREHMLSEQENIRLAWSDQAFKQFYQHEMNKHIEEPTQLLVTDQTPIYHRWESGWLQTTSCYELYEGGRKNTFSVRERHHLRASDDEELLMFVPNEKEKEKLKNFKITNTKEIHIICPYCGSEDDRKINAIAFKNPKCKICKDTGFKETKIGSRMDDNIYVISENKRHEKHTTL